MSDVFLWLAKFPTGGPISCSRGPGTGSQTLQSIMTLVPFAIDFQRRSSSETPIQQSLVDLEKLGCSRTLSMGYTKVQSRGFHWPWKRLFQ